MDAEPTDQTVIDLISDKHAALRRVAEERWERGAGYAMSHAEAHLLAMVRRGSLSIAQASRLLNVSRQAAQKCASRLEDRGFLTFARAPGNARDKYLLLSPSGLAYCDDSERLKRLIEREIEDAIGSERLSALKDLLRTRWLEDEGEGIGRRD